jgi:hypothetical protein
LLICTNCHHANGSQSQMSFLMPILPRDSTLLDAALLLYCCENQFRLAAASAYECQQLNLIDRLKKETSSRGLEGRRGTVVHDRGAKVGLPVPEVASHLFSGKIQNARSAVICTAVQRTPDHLSACPFGLTSAFRSITISVYTGDTRAQRPEMSQLALLLDNSQCCDCDGNNHNSSTRHRHKRDCYAESQHSQLPHPP